MLGHSSISQTVDTYARWLPYGDIKTANILAEALCYETVTNLDSVAEAAK